MLDIVRVLKPDKKQGVLTWPLFQVNLENTQNLRIILIGLISLIFHEMKDEIGGVFIIEFVGLRSKIYCIVVYCNIC